MKVCACPFSYVVFIASATAYTVYLRKRRNNAIEERSSRKKVSSNTTADSKEKYQVVFVLGGPGSGKGTQCDRLSKNLNWAHLSAGDLLRAERQNPNSELGELINSKIAAGQLVPSEITVRLIQNAMDDLYRSENKTKFLIDGFPRSEGNVSAWKECMHKEAKVEFVLFLDCPEDTMISRLLDRGQTSGRNDDNLDVIRKRFETFRKESMPIVEMYEKEGKLRRIAADRSIDAVYKEISSLFENL